MKAGPYSFLWEDGKKYTKPTKVPANEYIELLFGWIKNLMEDPKVFPQGGQFTKEFHSAIKKIWKRLGRVFFRTF